MIDKVKGSEETSYAWEPLDHLAKVEGSSGTASYAYDALGRLSERTSESGTWAAHYGDLTDLPTYDANGEGETVTSYVQGAHGLVEQRSGEATAYPLADAHGDITAITGPTGGVESRQSYDPWGVQLSGPTLEMGYLGGQERRADPMSGLIQMGARSYDPALGSFFSEDPMLTTIGAAQISNHYAYAADRTPNLTDLTGRYPFESVVNGAKEMVESWAEDPLNFGDPRELVTAAQEYWVQSESPLSYPAGSLVSIIDLAVNPSRLDDYMKYHLPGKQLLEDCYNGGHPARTIGSIAGATGGFIRGTASAVGDLGARGVGVGVVSGAAGGGIGATVGTLGGCGVGVIAGLVG